MNSQVSYQVQICMEHIYGGADSNLHWYKYIVIVYTLYKMHTQARDFRLFFKQIHGDFFYYRFRHLYQQRFKMVHSKERHFKAVMISGQ